MFFCGEREHYVLLGSLSWFINVLFLYIIPLLACYSLS